MKKIIYNIILFAAAFAASCTNDYIVNIASETEGIASVKFNMPEAVTRAYDSNAYPWKDDCDIRIYKNSDLGKELIRHYFGLDEMPSELWLLAGDYHISVSLGSKAAATFDEPSHFGESDFSIKAGQSTDVEVECNLLNTVVEVEYDESIAATFDMDYRTIVQIADTFGGTLTEGENSLTYTSSRKGYFMLPAGTERISFCFFGHSSDSKVQDKDGNEDPEVGEIHEHYTKALEPDKLAGYCYKIKFKYSPDPQGHLSMDFEVSVDESTDDSEHWAGINPSPKPLISLTDGDINSVNDVVDRLEYAISSQESNLKSINIDVDGAAEYDLDLASLSTGDTQHDGISVNVDNLREVKLSLGKAFFDKVKGGEHVVTLSATAMNNAEGTARSEIRTQGVYSLEPTDKWNAKGEIKAYVFAEASTVKIQYRAKNAGEWKSADAVSDGSNLYTATAEGINADTEYEYQLLLDGETTGAVDSVTTDSGPQIYNSGFETWSQPSAAYLPYSSVSDQWWDTGNHGSTSLGSNWNITTPESDVHEGSAGTTSAKLSSKYVIMKFAAGNIFVGVYAGTNQTDGVIAFGKPFDYTYRPKKLSFWYKSTVGNINRGSGAPGVSSGDPDPNEVYIMLCKMDGPHIVSTADKSTLVDVKSKTIGYCTAGSYDKNSTNDKTDGHVVAYGLWNNTQTQNEWTKAEIDLQFNEEYEGEIPTYIMLTASASKYGDYFVGCDSNVLCLDDFELVY